jgi:hypothetical protein
MEGDTLDICGSEPLARIFGRCAGLASRPRDEIRLFFAGRQIQDGGSAVHKVGLTDGSQLAATLRMRGGRPVIYLYPPTVMDVSVNFGLIPAWRYSAFYLLTKVTTQELAKGQVRRLIEWNVNAKPSGLLRDKVSKKDIAYLFWGSACALCLALQCSN